MNSKIIAVLIIAGLGCLVFGVFVAPSINQSVLEESKNAAINDESETNVTKCTIKSFHLERYQTVTIKLFVYINESSTTDDTFHMKIVSWKTWNASQVADPSAVTGESYRYAAPTHPPTTLTYTASPDFAWVEGTYYTIEFKGDAPTMTKPLPGDYRIIIFNEDLNTFDNTTLYYDLTITQDGLGATLNLWFTVIGLGLLVVGVVLVVISRKR